MSQEFDGQRSLIRRLHGLHRGRLVAAIEGCGVLLAEQFPRRPDDKDELTNRLIEI